MKVLIVVTHLLGSGHLSRAVSLAGAFKDAGHEAVLASGGMPVPHLEAQGVKIVQLPPLRSNGVDFSLLLDQDNQPVSHDLMARRTDTLLQLLRRLSPDLVVTELFPFGRRILANEFCSLLETAHQMTPRPAICASVRDILAPPSKPAKTELAHSLISTFYDAVFVHSDPAVTPLETSWPVIPSLAEKIQYTGYVVPSDGPADHPLGGRGEILVSTGGGNVGTGVFETAITAAEQSPDLVWRLFVAGMDAASRVEKYTRRAAANVTVQQAAPDFRNMLHTAKASVSLCGYNTALDVLRAGTPVVFVPFDEGGETEQSLRATTLSSLDGIEVLKTSDLTPGRLIASLRAAILAPKRPPMTHNMNGAARTVTLAETLVGEHRCEG